MNDLKPLDFSEEGIAATFQEPDRGLATRNRMRYALAALDRLAATGKMHEHEAHGYVGAPCDCKLPMPGEPKHVHYRVLLREYKVGDYVEGDPVPHVGFINKAYFDANVKPWSGWHVEYRADRHRVIHEQDDHLEGGFIVIEVGGSCRAAITLYGISGLPVVEEI